MEMLISGPVDWMGASKDEKSGRRSRSYTITYQGVNQVENDSGSRRIIVIGGQQPPDPIRPQGTVVRLTRRHISPARPRLRAVLAVVSD